ncbi:MAG: 6-phosphofructokinase [Rhodospirillales bacterium]
MLAGNVLIAQGGGPTAVINQSLVGAVLAARALPGVKNIIGARHGVRGIIDEDLVDLTREPEAGLETVARTPCSALGSTRDKPDAEYCRRIFEVLKAHDVGSFFYIGGNDSSDVARIVADEAKAEGVTLRCVHIPKTIDNDLVINDHTPGYGSAARFVASAFAGVDQDNRALPGVYIGVVMGRHAGFLTAAAAAARRGADDGPHLIYLPERDFSPDTFTAEVKAVYDRLGRCVIAVSEGVHDAGGTPVLAGLSENIERDAHGNVQLSGTGALADLLAAEIKAKTEIKRVRADTFGYLQRSFLGCVSETDSAEARAAGAAAVRFADEQDRDGSVVIRRVGGPKNYAAEFDMADLADIAGKTKVMDDAFIAPSGHDVTGAFMDYLRPLLGGDLPPAGQLNAPRVEKRLGG